MVYSISHIIILGKTNAAAYELYAIVAEAHGRIAHKLHSFIDPTWVSGVTNGHVLQGSNEFTDENLPEATLTPVSNKWFNQ
jgi:hypothetical protein